MSDKAKAEDRYVKIMGSGEVVRVKNFSEISQLYDVESASGKFSTVQSNKVSQQVTPVETAEFARWQQERSVT
jgi:hypothetical protein